MLTLKEAYEIAKDVFEGFRITVCFELDESWLFITPCRDNGDAVFIRPLEILKSGEDCRFWDGDKKYRLMNCFERSDWLNANAKRITIEELNAL